MILKWIIIVRVVGSSGRGYWQVAGCCGFGSDTWLSTTRRKYLH